MGEKIEKGKLVTVITVPPLMVIVPNVPPYG